MQYQNLELQIPCQADAKWLCLKLENLENPQILMLNHDFPMLSPLHLLYFRVFFGIRYISRHPVRRGGGSQELPVQWPFGSFLRIEALECMENSTAAGGLSG